MASRRGSLVGKPGWTKPWSGKGIAFSWGYVGSDNSGIVLGPRLLLVDHDTTDDFILMASKEGADSCVDIEFTFEEGERMARWILDAIATRQSPEGQALQQAERRDSEEHAGHPIVWRNPET